MNQIDLTDTSRIFQPNTKEYSFSGPRGSFFKANDVGGHKAGISRYMLNSEAQGAVHFLDI